MKTPTDFETLMLRAGFRTMDGRVYAALEAPDASVAAIARVAGLHRARVYQSLERMLDAGLVVRKKYGRRAVYRRGPAAVLRALLKKTDAETQRALRAIDARSLPDAIGVQVLTGKKGLASVLDLMLKDTPRSGVFYRYSSRAADIDIDQYMPSSYRRGRDTKRLQQFVITSERLRQKPYKKRLECASKCIPAKEDRFEYGVNVLIFCDKVAFVNFREERASIIEDKNLAELQRSLFMLLYRRLKE